MSKKNGKQPHRQTVWWRKRVEAGLCPGCGEPSDRDGYCFACLAPRRLAARKRYRRKHGLDEDAPRSARGRKPEVPAKMRAKKKTARKRS